MIWFFIALTLVFIVGMVLANSTKKTDYGTEYGISESAEYEAQPAMKNQFVGHFSTNHEARTVCDDINQDGYKMYVDGASIFTDNPLDDYFRDRMNELHEDYYATHKGE